MIKNGTFDYDLSDWNISPSGDADAVWDNGRARLRVFKCSSVKMTQDLIIDGDTITFDWETKAEGWWEATYWKLIVEGNEVIFDGFPMVEYGSRSGSVQKDISQYIGKNATIEFGLYPSSYCGFGDHYNSYLWIDNIFIILPLTCRFEII